jgi:hypothetical protein
MTGAGHRASSTIESTQFPARRENLGCSYASRGELISNIYATGSDAASSRTAAAGSRGAASFRGSSCPNFVSRPCPHPGWVPAHVTVPLCLRHAFRCIEGSDRLKRGGARLAVVKALPRRRDSLPTPKRARGQMAILQNPYFQNV